MQFTVVDVETANPNMSSICQIGIAVFSEGKLAEEWSTLVDPEDYFDDVNVSIHEITPEMIDGKPKLLDIADKLQDLLVGKLIVSHTRFDRIALERAFAKYGLNPIAASWLDSARVVRRTWQELASSGYGLANVCKKIGYEFAHHDALEDAKAAGHVLLAAMAESNMDLDAWIHRINQRKTHSSSPWIHRDANPDGDLFGEVMVFTGALSMPRREAADLASSQGCQVDENVTKKTTILVVGDQDIARLVGHEKSSKHRKAEKLAMEGQVIRILCESDFKTMCSNS